MRYSIGEVIEVGHCHTVGVVVAVEKVGRYYAYTVDTADKETLVVSWRYININTERVLSRRAPAIDMAIDEPITAGMLDRGAIRYVKADGSERVASFYCLYNRNNGCIGYYDTGCGDWRAFRIERVLTLSIDGIGERKGEEAQALLVERFGK